MGFDESVLDLIWRILSNYIYFILINGQDRNFFHLSRGVNQRDPLSPVLFILSIEFLSTTLNQLFYDFGMPKCNDKLNHLMYAYNTIIFASS